MYGNVLKCIAQPLSSSLVSFCGSHFSREGQPHAKGESPGKYSVNVCKRETNKQRCAIAPSHCKYPLEMKKKIRIPPLTSQAWLPKLGGIATLVNLQKYFYNFIRGFNSVLYLPLLVCKIALNIQVVINESFMLQIKHFHLCCGTVAARRRGLKCNCFYCSPRSAECLFTLYYIIGFCFSSSALPHILSFHICSLFFSLFYFFLQFKISYCAFARDIPKEMETL